MVDKYDAFLEGGDSTSVMSKYDTFLDGTVKEKPKEPWIVENAPLIGSVLGGMIGGASGAVTPIPGGMMAGSVAGTAAGTSIGSSARQLYRGLTEEPVVPAQPTGEFLKGQAKDVAEQSAWDLAGNLAFKGITLGYRSLVPKAVPKIAEGGAEAQALMKEYGGSLTPGQIAPSAPISRIEGTLKSGILSKGVVEGQYAAQDATLKAIRDSFLKPDRLDPIQRGQIFIDAINGGNKALDQAASKLYGELDNIAVSTGASVNISPVKTLASSILDQQKRIGNVGLTDQGGEILNKLAAGNTSLSFADAHVLRSSLLSRARGLDSGDLAKKNINDFVDVLNKQMESGAKTAGGDLWDKYRNVSNFYKSSINRLNDDYIKDLIKQKPESIGDALYTAGNVTGVTKARIALRRAAALDKSIDYKATMDTIKEGFVESLLTSRNKLTKEGETQGVALLKDFEEKKMKHTIDAMLTPEFSSKLKTFAEASMLAQSRPESVLPILTSMVQASAVVGLGGYVIGKGDPDALGLAAPIILGPRVMAKLLIKPGMVDKLILASTAVPGKTPISKGFITKLISEMIKTKEEVEGKSNEPK